MVANRLPYETQYKIYSFVKYVNIQNIIGVFTKMNPTNQNLKLFFPPTCHTVPVCFHLELFHLCFFVLALARPLERYYLLIGNLSVCDNFVWQTGCLDFYIYLFHRLFSNRMLCFLLLSY